MSDEHGDVTDQESSEAVEHLDRSEQPEPETPEDLERSEPRSLWARAREYVLVVAIAIGLSFAVKTFVIQPFWIPSGSMENTLITGDRIVVNKLPGSTNDLQRGDIVVFEDPDGWLPRAPENEGVGGAVKTGLQFVGLYPAGEQHLVKRIIGTGGDHVVCCDDRDRITVNGTPINERYLDAGTKPSETDFDIRVPKGQLWLMGDNRAHSADSRAHDADGGGSVGSVPEVKVTGKVLAVVWPLSRLERPADAHAVFDKVRDP